MKNSFVKAGLRTVCILVFFALTCGIFLSAMFVTDNITDNIEQASATVGLDAYGRRTSAEININAGVGGLVDNASSKWFYGSVGSAFPSCEITTKNGYALSGYSYQIRIKQVTATDETTLVLLNNGQVWGAGDNQYGQLAQGHFTEVVSSWVQLKLPSAVTESNPVIKVAGGRQATYILLKDGTVWACGSNEYAVLGIDSEEYSKKYAEFQQCKFYGGSPVSNVKDIGAGKYHAAILTEDKSLYTCGYHEYGQLGCAHGRYAKVKGFSHTQYYDNGSKYEFSKKVDRMWVGWESIFVDSTNGNMYSCGRNAEGNLGQGHNSDSYVFDKVKGIDGSGDLSYAKVASIAAGRDITYMVSNTGELYSVGFNNDGALADGTTTSRNVFKQARYESGSKLIDDAAQVAVGTEERHVVMINERGEAYAAGHNYYGQCGTGNTSYPKYMTAMKIQNSAGGSNTAQNMVYVGAGETKSILVGSDGEFYYAGRNYRSANGAGESTSATSGNYVKEVHDSSWGLGYVEVKEAKDLTEKLSFNNVTQFVDLEYTNLTATVDASTAVYNQDFTIKAGLWDGAGRTTSYRNVSLYYLGSTTEALETPEKLKTVQTDYSSKADITMSKHLDVGVYNFRLESSAAYGNTVTYDFQVEIKPRTLTTDMVKSIDGKFAYNSKEQTPHPALSDIVTRENTMKTKNAITEEDVTFTFANNLNAGTATVTVTPKKNYTGNALTRSFTINKAQVRFEKTGVVIEKNYDRTTEQNYPYYRNQHYVLSIINSPGCPLPTIELKTTDGKKETSYEYANVAANNNTVTATFVMSEAYKKNYVFEDQSQASKVADEWTQIYEARILKSQVKLLSFNMSAEITKSLIPFTKIYDGLNTFNTANIAETHYEYKNVSPKGGVVPKYGDEIKIVSAVYDNVNVNDVEAMRKVTAAFVLIDTLNFEIVEERNAQGATYGSAVYNGVITASEITLNKIFFNAVPIYWEYDQTSVDVSKLPWDKYFSWSATGKNVTFAQANSVLQATGELDDGRIDANTSLTISFTLNDANYSFKNGSSALVFTAKVIRVPESMRVKNNPLSMTYLAKRTVNCTRMSIIVTFTNGAEQEFIWSSPSLLDGWSVFYEGKNRYFEYGDTWFGLQYTESGVTINGVVEGITVKRIQLDVPKLELTDADGNYRYVYTRYSQSAVFNENGNDKQYYEIEGNGGRNAGVYNISISITDRNYEWKDGSTTASVRWEIYKRKLSVGDLEVTCDVDRVVHVTEKLPDLEVTSTWWGFGTIAWDEYVLSTSQSTYGWTWTPINSNNLEEVKGTCTFNNIKELAPESLEISGNYQKSYIAFDEFNTENLIVRAIYPSDSGVEPLTLTDNYRIEYKRGNTGNTLLAGDNCAYVVYEEKGVRVSATISGLTVEQKVVEIDLNSLVTTFEYDGTPKLVDIPESDLYWVRVPDECANAIEPGDYYVNLYLFDNSNYMWDNGLNGLKQVKFTIVKTANPIADLSLEGWTFGNEPNAPTARAQFGVVKYEYRGAAEEAYSAKVPTEAGTYFVRAYVEEAANWRRSVSEPVEFVIEKREVEIVWSENRLVYDGTDQSYKASAYFRDLSGRRVDVDVTAPEMKYYNADGYAATASLENANYKLPAEVTHTYYIERMKLTIKIGNSVTTYFAPTARLRSEIVSGSIAKQDAEVYSLYSEVKQDSPVGFYDVEGVAHNDNYEITFINGKEAYEITPAKLSANVIGYRGVYDGMTHNASAEIIASVKGNTKANFNYCLTPDGSFVSVVEIKKAGEYTIYFRATADNHTVVEGNFLAVIEKAKVEAPQIADKVYTGKTLYGDVDGSSYYYVSKNFGGINAGRYSVEMTLTDPENYKWTDGGSGAVTRYYNIIKAENGIEGLRISGWTFGQEASEPIAEATFGSEFIEYFYAPEFGTAFGDEVPTQAGKYMVKARVEGNANYGYAEAVAYFEIAKARYDMSGVTFEDAEFIENDRKYSLAVSGKLPDGVSVSYVGNGKQEVGVYEVTAKFAGDFRNYEVIGEMTAVLTIKAKAIADDSTSVEVETEGGLAPELKLEVKESEVSEAVSVDLSTINMSAKQVFDISLKKGDETVQPDSAITIRLLIASELRSKDNLKVYYVDDFGRLRDVNALREGDFMVFETTRLSRYVVAAPETKEDKIITYGLYAGGAVVLVLAVALAAMLVSRKRRGSVK